MVEGTEGGNNLLSRCKLLLLFVLCIAEDEDEVLMLAGLQFYFHIVRGDGAPTVSNTHCGFAGHDTLWFVEVVIQTDKRLAVGVEALGFGIGQGIIGVVVSALLVLGLVVDGRGLNS